MNDADQLTEDRDTPVARPRMIQRAAEETALREQLMHLQQLLTHEGLARQLAEQSARRAWQFAAGWGGARRR